MQVFIKEDGYVNQPDVDAADESEELLASLDESVPSNTIPELSTMSQVLAPNSIDAEMQSISLYSPHSAAGEIDMNDYGRTDENSNPNESAAQDHLRDRGQLEMQPVQKKHSILHNEQVCVCVCVVFCRHTNSCVCSHMHYEITLLGSQSHNV